MDLPLVNTEAQHILSASSSPYDSDAYNTTDARVYFGPLRSPEKKFIPNIAHSDNLHAHGVDSFLRRSPRLSSPRPVSLLPAAASDSIVEVKGRESDDTGLSYPGTPDNEQILQDEPSSILASRVMRAHDNPSPPPLGPKFIPTHDTSISVSPTPPLVGSPHPELISVSQNVTPPPNFCDRLVNCPMDNNTVVTPDLISFDSFSTPKDTFRYTVTEAGSSVQHNYVRSIDDLITPSPSLAHLRTDARSPIFKTITSPASDGEDVTSRDGPATTPNNIEEQGTIFNFLPPMDASPDSSQPEVHHILKSGHLQESDQARTGADALMQSDSLQHSNNTTLSVGESKTLPSSDSVDAASTPKGRKEGKRREELVEPVNDSGTSSRDEGDKIVSPIVAVPTQEKATRRGDRDIMNSPKQAGYRELGSLSPTSTDLLTQLLPSPTRETTHGNADDQVPKSPQLITSFPPILPVPQTPMRFTGPIRFSSPIRSNTTQSPNKPRLQPVALDDPSRTPARRIPIDEAVTQGHMSPQKAARMTADIGRAQVFNIRPTDSPARRVNIIEAHTPSSQTQKKWQGIRFGSPTRTVSRQQSTPVELQGAGSSDAKHTTKADSSQRPPLLGDAPFPRPQPSGSSSTVPPTIQKMAKLPFPIVASRDHPHSSRPEDLESKTRTGSSSKSPSIIPQSPIKSGLKQVTSKIPRGIKPYARPPLSKPLDKDTMKPNLIRKVEPPQGGSNTRITPKLAETRSDVAGANSNDNLELGPSIPTLSSTLKRKRVVEKVSSAPKSRPVVLLRQVPKVAGSQPKPTSATQTRKPVQSIRRVVDKRPEPPPIQPPPSDSAKDQHPYEEPLNIPVDATPEMSPPTSPMVIDITFSSPSLPPPTAVLEELSSSDTRRRTTRTRKPVKPISADDVFGVSEPRPAPSRRKPNSTQSTRSDGAFFGMTAVALKALTSSNTIKNQKYLAAKLETKVIRKEGARPESPAVKIRTISQRMQDEKARQRKERAARRARRSDDGLPGMEPTEVEGQSDSEDTSDCDDQNSSPCSKKHKRGPGEDEDYKTPIRSERQAKRPRTGEEGEETPKERRVKWDRGLFTMIYVDEVKVGTRPPPNQDLARKGCLALTAKTTVLDNLGNLPEADAPLSELVEESVEVKKFVYDNDVEPVSPVIVVKNTRLRSKKAKS